MAQSCSVFQFTDASIQFEDNTPTTPLTHTLINVVGDVNYSGGNAHGGQNRALAHYQTRGGENAPNGSSHVRAAAQEPPSLTINVQIADYTETTTGTTRDWVYRVAGTPYAAAVGFACADAEVFQFKVTITFTNPDSNGSDQTLTYTKVAVQTMDWTEGEPNTFTLNCLVYGTETPAVV